MKNPSWPTQLPSEAMLSQLKDVFMNEGKENNNCMGFLSLGIARLAARDQESRVHKLLASTSK